MDKNESLKLALEALENFVDVIKYDNEQDDIGFRACCYVLSYDQHSENCKATKAITAIKQALAAPVPDYAWPTVADYEKDVGFAVNDTFKAAWNMARTTNDLFTQMEKPNDPM